MCLAELYSGSSSSSSLMTKCSGLLVDQPNSQAKTLQFIYACYLISPLQAQRIQLAVLYVQNLAQL